ncbi:MAG: hypothetical protein ACUVSY_09040 [Roseiflexus sp.]
MKQRCSTQRTGYLYRRAERGQSLVFIALVLAFLTPFIFTVIEFSERQMEVAHLEDALQQSTRAGVQALDYAQLARNGQRIHQERALQIAGAAFVQNLSAVRGLAESPEALAKRVMWQVLPDGGMCPFSDGHVQTFDRPAVCAEVRPVLSGFGLLGYAPYRPLITAAATLDALTQ